MLDNLFYNSFRRHKKPGYRLSLILALEQGIEMENMVKHLCNGFVPDL
jgi:hypothetical protein